MGLFGIGPESAITPQSMNFQALNVRASGFGVWQKVSFAGDADPALADATLVHNAEFQQGTFGGTIGSVDYAFHHRSQNTEFYAAGQGWALEYSTIPDKPQLGANATVGLSRAAQLTRRITFQVATSAAYTPYFNFTPTPLTQSNGGINLLPIAVTPGLNVNALNASNASFTGSLGLSANISARSTLSASALFQEIYFLDKTASAANLTAFGGQVLYTRQLLKKLRAHAGYLQSQSRLRNPDRWSQPLRNVDLGLDYGDALHLTRRTTLSFNGGLATTRAVQGSSANPDSTQYRVLGNVNLDHFIGRTWVMGAGVSRTIGFVAGFREPVLADSAIANLTGQLATRLSWTSTASWMRGYVALDSSRHYDTAGASTSLFFGLTRRIATFAQYTYYSNRVPPDASLLPVFTNFDRQIASVGLSFFQPIFNTQRTR